MNKKKMLMSAVLASIMSLGGLAGYANVQAMV